MSKIGIIVRREFNERVKKKSFIVTTILVPVLFVAAMGIMVWLQTASLSEAKKILVVDNSQFVGPLLESGKALQFIPSDKSYEELKEENPDVFGILVIGADIVDNPSDLTLYTYKSSTVDQETTIERQIEQIIEDEKLKRYDIDNLAEIMNQIKTDVSLQAFQIDEAGAEKESSSLLAMISAIVTGILMFMFVTMYGSMVMQGVIEEKTNKVLEVMVSSVRPFELMMGKIFGVALVALTQFMIWVVLVLLIGAVASNTVLGDTVAAAQAMSNGMAVDANVTAVMDGMNTQTAAIINQLTDVGYMSGILVSFLIFFIGGYLVYAAIFAAIGSAVDNIQDSQQLQIPVTVLLMVSYFVLFSVMNDPYSQLAMWFSMIPFTSPIIMMARIPYGVPIWQIALSAVVLYGSFVLLVWLAGKIYRVGIFMYGKKPSFSELYKWMKYKS